MIATKIEIENLPEYDRHEKAVRVENAELGVAGFIALHRSLGGHPSFGATRLWAYSQEDEALRDVLRLSRTMSYKSAFADLPYGGAKATIVVKAGASLDRAKFFEWYAGVVNELEGAFVTGSDVGVGPEDVETMCRHSTFVVGHGVPADYYTALGVYKSIQSVAESIYGSTDLHRRTFAIQGLGKTGLGLLRLLHPEAATVLVSDIDPAKLLQVSREFPGVQTVSPESVHRSEVDVFCPCALQHSINSETIPELNCRAIIGSANNQLEKDDDCNELHARGIVYAPDYVVNNGGFVSVADQYMHGRHDDSRILRSLERTQEKLGELLELSRDTGLPPATLAGSQVEAVIQ